MFTLLFELWRSMRLGAAARADIADDQCVACGSTDLTMLGERAYRCNMCLYEGGSGLAEMQQAKREAVWASWTPEKRLASARADLEEAASMALAAEGSLSGASHMAKLDVIGLGGQSGGNDGRDDKQSVLTRALGEMAEAQARLKDAQAKIGSGVTVSDASLEADHVTWTLDIHMDGLYADLRMLNRIGDAQRAAADLAATIRKAQAALAG